MYPTKPICGTQIDPMHPISQELNGLWLMNEGAGSLVNDSSGNGNHGTLMNMSPNTQGTGWCGSRFGGALALDGVDDHVVVPNAAQLNITGEISIAVWIKFAQMGNMGVLSKGFGSVTEPYIMAYDGSSRYFQITDTVDTRFQASSAGGWPTGRWTHIVGTYDGVDIKLYQNGIVESVNAIGSVDMKTNTSDLIIGAYYSADYGSTGLIASVAIYNRALSIYAVQKLYYESFCNMRRVPVRYSPAAGGLPIPVAMYDYQRRRL